MIFGFDMRRITGQLFRSHKAFFFLNGLLVAFLFYFYTENVYEEQIFKALADNIRTSVEQEGHWSEDSIVLRSLEMTYFLERRRILVFGNSEIRGFKAELIQPVTFDLMTGRGSCASSSLVLGRILKEFNIPIRYGQMKVNGVYGGHIILEAFVKGEWKVLDALYNLKFIRPDGQLAQFKDLQQNWSYYQQQVPAHYKPEYRYEDVQRTNWNKIPLLLPFLKRTLLWVTDQAFVDSICLRVFFMKKFEVLFFLCLFLYGLVLIARMYILRKSAPLKLKVLPISSPEEKLQSVLSEKSDYTGRTRAV